MSKSEGPAGLSVLCVAAACADDSGKVPLEEDDDEDSEALEERTSPSARPSDRSRNGLVTYIAEATLALKGPLVREASVLHLCPRDGRSFRQATLSLYPNGLKIVTEGESEDELQETISLAWSPFSLVQACRLHSIAADAAQPWMRLFKISIFHHGITHFFATQGDKADMERARWVADVSRVIRVLTQSLFPPFSIAVDPVPGASWTSTRLLAGYLMLYDELGVSLVYGELHAHRDSCAAFAAYEDEWCDVQVVQLSIDMDTCVSERVGIDCSCFSLGDHHFSARSCAEKMLWLRAISNVKVKLRHWATNPSRRDLKHYRSSIREHSANMPQPDQGTLAGGPLLPVRGGPSVVPNERPESGDTDILGSAVVPTSTPPPLPGPMGPSASPPPRLQELGGGGGFGAEFKGPTPMMAAAAARLLAMPQRPTAAPDELSEPGGADDMPPPLPPPPPPPPPPQAPQPVAQQAELMVLRGGPV